MKCEIKKSWRRAVAGFCFLLSAFHIFPQEAINITNLPVVITISSNDTFLVSSYGPTGRTRQLPLYQLPSLLQSLGVGFASTNDVYGVTNGLASTNYVVSASTNSVKLIAGSHITIVTNTGNGLISFTIATDFDTNGLASTNYVVSASTNSVKLIAGSHITLSTNTGNGLINFTIATDFDTNGLASTNYVTVAATNSVKLIPGSHITLSTNTGNGLINFTIATDFDTNGLASTNYVVAASTNSVKLIPGSHITLSTNTGNGLINFTIATDFDTNGLASTNYVTFASTNAVKLIAGANTTITTNTGDGLISFTINSAANTNDIPAGVAVQSPPAPERPGHLFRQWRAEQNLLSAGGALDFQRIIGPSVVPLFDKQAIYYASYDAGWTGRVFAAYGNTLEGFSKHPTPVLSPSASGWDRGHLGSARIFQENGTNYLYYFAGTNYGVFEPPPEQIGVAYSTDGTNFTKYSGNPILTNGPAFTDGYTLYTFHVVKHGATYYGFYNAADTLSHSERIHLATAPDPLGPWSKYAGNPIFARTNGSFYIASDFSVFKLKGDGGWGAFYWWHDNVANQYEIAMAYSRDLTNWTDAGYLTNSGARINGTGPAFFDDNGPSFVAAWADTLTQYRPTPNVGELAAWRTNYWSGSNYWNGPQHLAGPQFRFWFGPGTKVRWDYPGSFTSQSADFSGATPIAANANQVTWQIITNTAATNIYYTPGNNFYLLNAQVVTNRVALLTNSVAWLEWRTDATTNITCLVHAGYGTPPATGGGGGLTAADIDTSAELAAILSDESGNGGGFLRQNNATLVAPNLGAATADTLNTGLGASELYPMDQSVASSASPVFVQVTAQVLAATTGTANTGYRSVWEGTDTKDLNFLREELSFTTNASFNATVQNLSAGRRTRVTYTNTALTEINVTLSSPAFFVNRGVVDTVFALAPTNTQIIDFKVTPDSKILAYHVHGIPSAPLENWVAALAAGTYLDAPTNAWTADTPFVLGITNAFLSQGAATIGITGILNRPTSTERFGQLTILATGTVVFTNAPGIKASDFTTSRTITNGNSAVIGISVIPGRATNMAIVQFL